MRLSHLLSSLFLIALLTFFSESAHAAPNDPSPHAHLELILYDGAVLQRRDGDGIWRLVCEHDCERDLSIERDVVGVEYRTDDVDGRKSPTFRIKAAPGERIVLIAHPPSETQRNVGVIAAVFGGIAFAVSSVGLAVAIGKSAGGCQEDSSSDSDCPSFAPIGLATGWSLVVTIVGLVLVAANSPTASQTLERPVTALFVREPKKEGRGAAPVALPSLGSEDALTTHLPHAWTAPLFTIHF